MKYILFLFIRLRIVILSIIYLVILFNFDANAGDCDKYIGKGYCVDYIKNKIGEKQSGNASQWKGNIQNIKEVKKGDVVIFPNLAGGLGHVAYVESVNKNNNNILSINISEKNYGVTMVNKSCGVTNMFNKIGYRTIKIEDVGRVWRPSNIILSPSSYGSISFGVKLNVAEKAVGEKAIIENGNNPEGIVISFRKYPGITFTTDGMKVVVRADIKKNISTECGNVYIGMPISNLKALYKNLKIEQQRDESGRMQREYSIVSKNGKSAIKFIELGKSRFGNRVVYSGFVNDIIAGINGYIQVGENFD